MISARRFDYVIFLVFLLVLSLDPTGGFFHLKEILFVSLFVIGLLFTTIRRLSFNREIISVIVWLFLCSIYGITISYLTQYRLDEDFIKAYLKSTLFIFIILYLLTVDFKTIQKYLWINGIVMSLVTLVIFGIAVNNEIMFSQLYEMSKEHQFIRMGNREFLGYEVMGVMLRAAPLMFFSLIYSMYSYEGKLKILFIALGLASFLVAGSRTPPLLAIALFLLYLKDKKIGGGFFNAIFVFAAIIAVFFLIYKLAADTGEASNELKYSNMSSYVADISEPSHFLFGAGIGSLFWAAGDGKYLSYTELTYFDIYRMLGVIVGTLYIIFVIYMPFYITFFSKKATKILKRYALGYLAYMVLVGTNPFLFNSTGMLVLALGLRMMYEVTNRKKRYD